MSPRERLEFEAEGRWMDRNRTEIEVERNPNLPASACTPTSTRKTDAAVANRAARTDRAGSGQGLPDVGVAEVFALEQQGFAGIGREGVREAVAEVEAGGMA